MKIEMLLSLSISKYLLKYSVIYAILCLCFVSSYSLKELFSSANCTDVQCINGNCQNDTCVCDDGWWGQNCQFCGGRVRLTEDSGFIYDGPDNYPLDSTCTWLIEAEDTKNKFINLRFEEFITECGWDHLYIFDGDSVASPLLGAFSGKMYTDDYKIKKMPEIVAYSGSVLLHFHSDIAYNMVGFNISYRLNSCPSSSISGNCSEHGICVQGYCMCEPLYVGVACDISACPNNCTYENGICNREKYRCDCADGYKGEDCSQIADLGYWEFIQPKGSFLFGSASHSAVVWQHFLYVIGGESYKRGKLMYKYNFNRNKWTTPYLNEKVTNVPQTRYGHSVALFEDLIYMYGGVEETGIVTNELWQFNIGDMLWKNITGQVKQCNASGLDSKFCGPLRSAGHSALVIPNKASNQPDRMILIFGHSPAYGYLNTIQEYYFGTHQWEIVKTNGFPVKGGYGHSAAWDPLSERIYVFGGLVLESISTPILNNKVYSYDPVTHVWLSLSSAPSARFLHTAAFISGGMMLIFGGNSYGSTTVNSKAKCYSSDMMAYDVTCNSWKKLSVPQLRSDLDRFGHSANVYEDSLYIYGGFNGQMLSDIVKFTPGKCESFTNQTACLSATIGVKCVWNKRESKCQLITNITISDEDDIYSKCPEEKQSSNKKLCSYLKDHLSCEYTSEQCVWCGKAGCSYQECKDTSDFINDWRDDQKCDPLEEPICKQIYNCQACNANSHCQWDSEKGCISCENKNKEQVLLTCPNICSELTSCHKCTTEDCIWCQSEDRCIDKNAYSLSFPYGLCREWTTHQTRCHSVSDNSICSFYKTCNECQNDPACGWCDDGSETGTGQCLSGGNAGPNQLGFACEVKNWYFTECPVCQCNGHSSCALNNSVCNQPCANFTRGLFCEQCIPGYFGNPHNGGSCIPCECNDQGTECNPDTGKCICTTKGTIGDHCERCDSRNFYHGDPTNRESCYYELTIDYQFTFNLSKKTDRRFTQINFKNSPPKADLDTDFRITCFEKAKFNITVETEDGYKTLFTNVYCETFRAQFPTAEYQFGSPNNTSLTTFYVNIYDMHPPMVFNIAFAQYPKLNLQPDFNSTLSDE